MTNGIRYYIKVAVVNILGTSANSSEVSQVAATRPTVPMKFTATAGDGFVNLTWSAPAYDGGVPINHYEISRGLSPGSEKGYRGVIMTRLLDTNVTNNHTYFYKVYAVNEAGFYSSIPPEVNATPVKPTTPSLPPSLTPDPTPDPTPVPSSSAVGDQSLIAIAIGIGGGAAAVIIVAIYRKKKLIRN